MTDWLQEKAYIELRFQIFRCCSLNAWSDCRHWELPLPKCTVGNTFDPISDDLSLLARMLSADIKVEPLLTSSQRTLVTHSCQIDGSRKGLRFKQSVLK
ncbi:MAG: hypothetical protein EZS28_006396 [Streblomastix strix]|uniref:Uncharacterized protein n=1 Tax=Streblomastix strix TaxID=222440 RepID=A0A5J4WSF8_9EUKA|nr:MAG: hypothetical protein EZS28_006386 [Streblomastix strix]KAA6398087.1 MAG: hypothetical protein EZS28_006396 [Streblomastix strix]